MINKITEINQMIKTNANEFVLKVEDEYHKRIRNIAKIITKKKGINFVLLAGPSASGKTTSSKLLQKYLNDMGVKTDTISLDDFYKTHEEMPRDEFGQLDFERVDSLKLERIEKCFKELLAIGKASVPIFDFNLKRPLDEDREVELQENDVIIIEGLHALNPEITKHLPKDKIFKLYISVGIGYLDDNNEVIIESRPIRLMRRMSRDIVYRDSPLERSLHLWTSVIRGEDKYLCPFRPLADMELESFHEYEICIFKGILEDKLKALSSEVENYDSVLRILEAMKYATYLDKRFVPNSSLLNEFMHK